MKNMKAFIRILCMVMALLMTFTIVGCNGGNNNSSNNGTSDSTNLPPVEPNNDKVLLKGLFENPAMEDLPMVQMHDPTQGLIDDVYRRGYGGICMNVAWDRDYLNNSRAWSNFANVVSYAIDKKGMYVWIYDEYGYPSGAAYGNTLKGNPEYEALGLVPGYAVAKAGSDATVNLVYGHTAIEAAYVYDGSSKDGMDLSSAQDVSSLISADKKSVRYVNRTGTDKVLVAYMSKRWYENTHSMANWYAQQRYINMLDPEPTAKFLNITHDRYYEAVGEYFGKGIKAFFTDEPALQGSYFNIDDRNRQVIDVPDMNIPIIESLNYSNTLFEKFNDAYGYDLEPLLGYLYNDDKSTAAKQVRMDFYQLTSDLFMNNYLVQTYDWCEKYGVKSSGHLLLEETLYQNPWFAGNMLQLIGSMGIPGTDLLYSTGSRAMKDASVTSKFASSSADFLGKTDTFSEISGAFDGTAGDMYSQLNAVGAQVAMGINTFSSYYYQGNDHTIEEDKIFSTAIGRMRYMTTGTTHDSKVAVYYPYEGVSAETLPSTNMWQPTQEARYISDSFVDTCNELVSKQVDYDIVDSINLNKCTIENGALVAPNGERYQALVLPYTTALRSEAVLKIIEAINAGVQVVMEDYTNIVCEKGKNEIAKRFSEIRAKAKVVTTATAGAKFLREKGYGTAFVDDNFAADFYVTKRQNKNYSVFTVVNAFTSNKTYNITLDAIGRSVKWYDTVTGEIKDVSGVKYTDKNLSFSFEFPANRTGFFVVEK